MDIQSQRRGRSRSVGDRLGFAAVSGLVGTEVGVTKSIMYRREADVDKLLHAWRVMRLDTHRNRADKSNSRDECALSIVSDAAQAHRSWGHVYGLPRRVAAQRQHRVYRTREENVQFVNLDPLARFHVWPCQQVRPANAAQSRLETRE